MPIPRAPPFFYTYNVATPPSSYLFFKCVCLTSLLCTFLFFFLAFLTQVPYHTALQQRKKINPCILNLILYVTLEMNESSDTNTSFSLDEIRRQLAALGYDNVAPERLEQFQARVNKVN